MIPISTFNMLIGVMIVLFLYSVIDLRNHYYANIMTSFVCALVAFYLSVAISVGVVQYDYGTVITDLSTGFILIIFAVAMMIYSGIMVYDAYIEYREMKEKII